MAINLYNSYLKRLIIHYNIVINNCL